MEKTNKDEVIEFLPGVYASSTTSKLKSIANKPMEAYINKRRSEVDTEVVQKRRTAEANMMTSSFRVQPFVGPISGRQKKHRTAVVAHGIYNRETGKMIRPVDDSPKIIDALKEPVINTIIVDNSKPKPTIITKTVEGAVVTEEIIAPPTYKASLDTQQVAKILASSPDILVSDAPIQGRLVFRALDGDFEIEANLVRVKLENSDVYAQYDRTLAEVLDEQFGKFKGPKPFSKVIESKSAETSSPMGNTTNTKPVSDLEIVPALGSVITNEVVHEINQKSNFNTNVIDKQANTPNVIEKTEIPVARIFPTDFYYEIPSLELLDEGSRNREDNDEWAVTKMEILERTFENFGVAVSVTGDFVQGATVTQFEIAPEPGTKMSRIKGLAEDLKLALSVDDLRIEAIAGKSTIGIEIANDQRQIVRLKEVLSSPEFMLSESPLLVGLGEDITGAAVYTDILTMPHGLVAGQTGSGKSVCINTLLVSILFKATPEEVRLMLIDPKQVEMTMYNDIPHLVTPVITDEKKAATALGWAVDEMERRYTTFAKNGVRDIKTFNKKRKSFSTAYEQMPYIVIIIDELADLMMVAAQDVEDAIMRLTQKARAAGIHLIVATQRPTVNVITGTIKSNVPTRIAFAVAQANDSRVILDGNGAEDLLGRGDMLIAESGNKIRRVQGAFVSDDEVMRVVDAVKKQSQPRYLIAEDALDKRLEVATGGTEDDVERAAMELFIVEQKASVSLLQRKLSMGYNKAARVVDQLEEKGWISPPMGAASNRDVLLTLAELDRVFE